MISKRKTGSKRIKKAYPIRRTKKSNSSPQKLKNITFSDKLVLYLNDALSLEKAAIERLQSRIRQTRLQDSKIQLQNHLEETREQQNRLIQLISGLGGKPTKDIGRLPIPSSSKSIENSKKYMTDAEAEIRGAKEDAIVESAEIVLYDTLIQLAQKASTVVGGDAIRILTRNLDEERATMDWIKANTPVLITQLWPDVAGSVAGIEGGETGIGEAMSYQE
ncbi:MAG: ferritin-like domain-containing protein [Nitrososphaeraceae archaeon]